MSPSRRLLRTVPLLEDESLASFVTRLDLANYYPRNLTLKLAIRQANANALRAPSLNYLRQPDLIRSLAWLSNQSCLAIYGATVHEFATVIAPDDEEADTIPIEGVQRVVFRTLVGTRHIRPWNASAYCPMCVAEEPHHQRLWSLQLVTACLKHESLLADRCLSCGAVVDAQSVASGVCPRCRQSLGATRATPAVSGDAITAQRLIHSLLLTDANRTGLPSLPELERDQIYRLAYALSTAISRVQRQRRGQDFTPEASYARTNSRSMRATPLAETHHIVCTATTALFDWPTRFFEFLDDIKLDRGSPYLDLEPVVAYLLKGPWLSAEPTPITEAFNQYISSRYAAIFEWTASRSARNRAAVNSQMMSYVPARVAREALGLTNAKLQELTRIGRLRRLFVRPGKDYLFVHRADLACLAAEKAAVLPDRQVCMRLGIHPLALVQLIDRGILPRADLPHPLQPAGNPVMQSALRQFQARVDAALKIDPGASVTMKSAIGFMYRVGLGSEAEVIEAVLEGSLRACKPTATPIEVAEIRFRIEDIDEYVEALASEFGAMSIRKATHTLGLTEELTRSIAKSGALESIRIKGQLFFPIASVQDLQANMVPTSVISALHHMKAKTITELIDSDQLPPAVLIHGRGKPHRITLVHRQAFADWRSNLMTRTEVQAQFGLPRWRLRRLLKQFDLLPVRLPYDEHHYYLREEVESVFPQASN